MPLQNTVFRQLTKFIPLGVLHRFVDEHDADCRVRRLSSESQLLVMIFGQLAGTRSLRELESQLESHAPRLYHAGLSRVRRSTLADANANRPAEVFTDLFAAMVGSLPRGLRRVVGEAVHLIDSTTIRLNLLSANWARFSAEACGVKAPVVYDANGGHPVYLDVTPERVNDITAARQMPIEANATYVFDLGYYDYGWWAPMAKPVREIRVRIMLTNDLTAPASEILKSRHFLGIGENAVHIQIVVALITFLLIKLAHAQQSAVASLTTFARLLGTNLVHRKPLEHLC